MSAKLNVLVAGAALAMSGVPAWAGPLSYLFDFAPANLLPGATFSYLSSTATAPGTSISPLLFSPEVGLATSAFGTRQSDGTWKFSLSPIDPHVSYTFVASTDLDFPNSPGTYTVPSIVSFAGICFPCPPSGPFAGAVTITISDAPEAGSLPLLCFGLIALRGFMLARQRRRNIDNILYGPRSCRTGAGALEVDG